MLEISKSDIIKKYKKSCVYILLACEYNTAKWVNSFAKKVSFYDSDY